jgi:transcriptional regulator with XRE-family HTH domain
VKYAPAHRSMANPNVAVFLLRVRKMHGLSQARAAKLAGISVGMLSMLEHGKRRPSIVVAEQLAEAYRIPLDARSMLMAEALPGVGKDSPYKHAKQRLP